jgi:hypothetical protein
MTDMPDEETEYTIGNDFDPDGDMPASADPMTEYLSYLADVRGGAGRYAVHVGGFRLDEAKALHKKEEELCLELAPTRPNAFSNSSRFRSAIRIPGRRTTRLSANSWTGASEPVSPILKISSRSMSLPTSNSIQARPRRSSSTWPRSG